MDNENSFMNIGDLAKPVNTLVEKISDAVEGIAKPSQIVRVAKAEAEAKKILANADVEIAELQQRTLTRLLSEESQRQLNMESIVRKALPEVTEAAHPEDINKDWLTHFFDKARLISDNDMQDLWGQVLAGQANSPGSYSKKTIDVLATLERYDAVMFSKLGSYCVFTQGGGIYALIYDLDNKIYANSGIDFGLLSHLESLGLLQFNILGPYHIKVYEQTMSFGYLDCELKVEYEKSPNNFEVGRIKFTKAGEELIVLSDAEPLTGFTDYIMEKWRNSGLKVERILDTSSEGTDGRPKSN